MGKIKKLQFIEYNCFINDIGNQIYSNKTKSDIQGFIQQNLETEITIRMSAELTRSQAQNRLQHLIYPAIGAALILSGDTNPLLLQMEYVKQKVVKPMFLTVYEGTPDQYVRSTADLTVYESWVFTNQCLNYLLNIGGALSESMSKQYQGIISRYKLESAIDETLTRS